jgi:transcriptional regulator GlxA family with amidase domain
MRVGFLIYPGFELSSVVGPADVLAEGAQTAGAAARYEAVLIGSSPGAIPSSCGVRLVSDFSVQDNIEDLDSLIIPQSDGGRPSHWNEELVRWLASKAARLRRVSAICSGSFLLAEAGLLHARTIATHWSSVQLMSRWYDDINIDADRILSKDGNIYTAAGLSAGLDLALMFLEEDFGRDVAREVARSLLLFPSRAEGLQQYKPASASSEVANRKRIEDAMEWARKHLGSPLNAEQLALEAGMSALNFTQGFTQLVGCSPEEFIEHERVYAAARLLVDTDFPIARVATLCGFDGPTSMRRAFAREDLDAPSVLRLRARASDHSWSVKDRLH